MTRWIVLQSWVLSGHVPQWEHVKLMTRIMQVDTQPALLSA